MFARILLVILLFAAACSSDSPSADMADAGQTFCSSDDVCGPDAVCVNGACRPATACESVSCARGVCASGTGECVNADSCDSSVGDIQCLAGYVCDQGGCIGEDELCAKLACARGQCDVDSRRCVAPESCRADSDCLEDQVCFDAECVIDHCATTECEFGRCLQSLGGSCVNVYPCSAPEHCLEEWDCHNGECVKAPCDGYCPGRQVCSSPKVGSGPKCSESVDGCLIATDCLDDRICSEFRCADLPQCVQESSEPNDEFATATPIPVDSSSAEALVRGALCSRDVDVYELDTSNRSADTTVTIDLSVPREFHGLTTFTVEAYDASGRTLGSATGEDPGPLTLLRASTASMFVKVSAAGSTGGPYDLVVAFDSPSELLNCDTRLDIGVPLLVTPLLSSFTTSTCGRDRSGSTGYFFELDRAQFVRVSVEPALPSARFAIVISTACGVSAANVDCFAGRTRGALRKFLPPGKYFVTVEADTDLSGQFAHEIELETYEPTCSPGAVACVDQGSATICGTSGNPSFSLSCDNGCDATSKDCDDVLSDSCVSAQPIDHGYSGLIDWRLLDDEFNFAGGIECGDGWNLAGEGVDAVFRVDLEPNQGFLATMDYGGFDSILFVVDDCIDDRSCLARTFRGGPNMTTQYVNTSLHPKTVFLVAEYGDDVYAYTSPSLLTLQKF